MTEEEHSILNAAALCCHILAAIYILEIYILAIYILEILLRKNQKRPRCVINGCHFLLWFEFVKSSAHN